jgi:soluble lytic murein transglycosylase
MPLLTPIAKLALVLPVMLLVAAPAPIPSQAEPGAARLAFDSAPPAASTLDAQHLAEAQALARLAEQLAAGDLAGAETSLARARGTGPLADYVALFEARLLLARGRTQDAAAAAGKGREKYTGAPIASAFSELQGDALATAGDETGARRAWQQAFEATRSAERRAALETRMLASHERTGTLHAAVARSGDARAVAEGKALPPSIARDLEPEPTAAELVRRADVLLRDGHGAPAIELYESALAAGLPPEQVRHARRERARALFQIRRYDESIAAFAALLPEPEARFWHARALARAGNVPASVQALEAIGASGDPRYGTWARYLAATLLEDRGETSRAMALYEQAASGETSEPALDSLWRMAWSSYGRGELAHARKLFLELAGRCEPLDALRPRYWAARAADGLGEHGLAKGELQSLALEYPLSYYGWRAGQRLGADAPTARASGPSRIARGRSQIAQAELERVELMLAAKLEGLAQEELGAIVERARSVEDRTSLGRLYALAGDFHRAQRLVVDAYQEPLSRGVDADHEALWWLSWPPAYREIVSESFPADAAIEPALVWAIMREESGYRPAVTSSAGARGLLQIMPETGARLAERTGFEGFDPDALYTPRVNIKLGVAYLDELGRRFPDRLSAAIGSYNAGPSAVSSWLEGAKAKREDDAWVEDIPYSQTRAYVKRVLRSLHVYRSVYDERTLLEKPRPASAAREG